MPPKVDGTDYKLLEPLFINKLIIVGLIKETYHPEANNAICVLKITVGDG